MYIHYILTIFTISSSSSLSPDKYGFLKAFTVTHVESRLLKVTTNYVWCWKVVKSYSIYATIYHIHNAIGVSAKGKICPPLLFVSSLRNMSVRLMTYTNNTALKTKESTPKTEFSTFTLLFTLNYLNWWRVWLFPENPIDFEMGSMYTNNKALCPSPLFSFISSMLPNC